jgi:hypothetical protein
MPSSALRGCEVRLPVSLLSLPAATPARDSNSIGDPYRVSAWGQSAGGISILSMLCSSEEILFSTAIVMSAGPRSKSLDRAIDEGERLMEARQRIWDMYICTQYTATGNIVHFTLPRYTAPFHSPMLPQAVGCGAIYPSAAARLACMRSTDPSLLRDTAGTLGLKFDACVDGVFLKSHSRALIERFVVLFLVVQLHPCMVWLYDVNVSRLPWLPSQNSPTVYRIECVRPIIKVNA